jgi:hypothetical protein
MKSAIVLVTLIVAGPARAETFGTDLAFLRGHTEVVVLGSGPARVAVAPGWQGRVLTSTANGEGGTSYGWINRSVIAAEKTLPHMTPYGGEDRFWLGPEGGQYALFFAKGQPLDFEHWQTPPSIDSEPWAVTARDQTSVRVTKEMKLVNHAGTRLELRAERTLRLLDVAAVKESCGRSPDGLSWVAFQSENRLVNTGRTRWTRARGLPSIWVLGMFTPSPATTVVVPAEKDVAVNDAYFGRVPAERLVRGQHAIFFRGDGQERGKIGLVAPARATLGSWDAAGRTLTVVWYNRPPGPRPYVNSLWPPQKNPYGGDAVNAYNDGPPAPGVPPMGPFYELETSSPAAELAPGAALEHVHRTMHLQGERSALDAMARACLGVGLDEVEAAFPPRPAGPSALESQPQGWVNVLPGPDLRGWTRAGWKNDLRRDLAIWKSDGKVLTCAAEQPAAVDGGKGGTHEWLRYDRPLRDFIWHVEWRFVDERRAGWNSGLVVRASPDLAVFHQAQVGGPSSGYWFGDTPDVTGKPVREKLAARELRVKPPGAWNTYEITATGDKLTLWVNGAVVSDWTVRTPGGHIGIEAELHRIELRNLMLKELPPK